MSTDPHTACADPSVAGSSTCFYTTGPRVSLVGFVVTATIFIAHEYTMKPILSRAFTTTHHGLDSHTFTFVNAVIWLEAASPSELLKVRLKGLNLPMLPGFSLISVQKEEMSLGTRLSSLYTQAVKSNLLLISAASEHAAWFVMHSSYLHK